VFEVCFEKQSVFIEYFLVENSFWDVGDPMRTSGTMAQRETSVGVIDPSVFQL
jgi:hypothetical protein